MGLFNKNAPKKVQDKVSHFKKENHTFGIYPQKYTYFLIFLTNSTVIKIQCRQYLNNFFTQVSDQCEFVVESTSKHCGNRAIAKIYGVCLAFAF